jgi:hypothetical protein
MILPYTAVTLLVLVTVYSALVSFKEQKGRTPGWIFPEPTSRSVQRVIGVLTLAILFGLAAWIASTARSSTHRSSRFLIPEGYTGWIRIEFEVQGAPPLPIENDQYVLKIPANGMLRTSSPEQYGWANDHYYYYSAETVRAIPDSGQSAMIWGKINGEASGSSGKRKYEEFFVGTNQQFKDQPK